MGGNNSINQKKLSEEFLNTHSSHYMYCPRCYLIPSIKPFLMKGELYISLYCKCLYDEKEYMTFESYVQLIMKKKETGNFCKKHKSTEGFLFCISCEKWLCDSCFIYHKEKYPKHLYNKIPIRLRQYCHRHEKEQAVGYCKNCGKNVCKNCLEAKMKLRHDVFIYYDKENAICITKKWNSFLEKHMSHTSINEKLKEEVINLINNDKNISDEEKKNWNKKLNDAYIKNKQINDKLSEYILFLFSNYDYSFHIGNIVNHNIFFNINNVKLNNSNFSINQQYSPIKNAEKLIKYYKNMFIIQLSPLVNIKNISSERKNVTNKQISKIILLDGHNIAILTSNGIIIVLNYFTYEELYRIKKVTVNENSLEKNDLNNAINTINTMENLQNFFLGTDEDDDDDEDFNNNLLNERIFRQQTQILNQIHNQNNINNKENKKINIIKVYNINNSIKHKSSLNSNDGSQNYNDVFNQNEINIINNDKTNEEEEGLELNFNFISMTYIKKYKLLALIIENCNEIYLFDITKKEALKEKLTAHKKEVLEILALKNDNLASYGKDFALRIWNIKNLQNFITINVEIKFYYIYFTQLLYGNLIFATGESVIKIFKLPDYEFENEITSVPQPMNYFELPDKKLIIASDDHYVRILRPPDYKEVTFLFNKRKKIYSFLLLDKKKLLVSLKDNSLHLMFFNKKNHKNNMQCVSTNSYSPIGSIVKTNDNRIISISWDNVVKIFLVGD